MLGRPADHESFTHARDVASLCVQGAGNLRPTEQTTCSSTPPKKVNRLFSVVGDGRCMSRLSVSACATSDPELCQQAMLRVQSSFTGGHNPHTSRPTLGSSNAGLDTKYNTYFMSRPEHASNQGTYFIQRNMSPYLSGVACRVHRSTRFGPEATPAVLGVTFLSRPEHASDKGTHTSCAGTHISYRGAGACVLVSPPPHTMGRMVVVKGPPQLDTRCCSPVHRRWLSC